MLQGKLTGRHGRTATGSNRNGRDIVLPPGVQCIDNDMALYPFGRFDGRRMVTWYDSSLFGNGSLAYMTVIQPYSNPRRGYSRRRGYGFQ